MNRISRLSPRALLAAVLIGVATLLVVAVLLMRENSERASRNAEQDRAIASLRTDNAALSTGVRDLRGATAEANRRLRSAGKAPVSVPNVEAPTVERGETGAAGSNGQNGRDGKDGQSIVGPAGAAGLSIIGPQGPSGQSIKGDTGAAGKDGRDGKDSTVPGPRGEQGEPGQSAYPFTFTFVIPGALGDTTYTCVVDSPGQAATCTS